MRLIDADALQLAIVEEGQANKRKKYIIGDIWELTGAEIREVINSQPTIQPEPLQPWEALAAQVVLPQPKRGKWIDTGGKEEWYAREYRCSECGDTMLGESNFCPNCGAKMEVTT